MPSKYYQPGAARAQSVEDLFATVAPYYDRINDFQSLGMHRLWKRRLVRLAAIRPGDSALDVCCGTGDITFLLAGEAADVTGLDFSAAMLEIARQRHTSPKRRPLPAHFVQGDALQLPFPDSSFDIVTIAYGLRNLSNVDRGLYELTRVLKPAGRLLILEFGRPDNPVLRFLYHFYLQRIIPFFGRIFCKDADTYRYILDSLKNYPAQHGIHTRLLALGYTSARIVPLLGGIMTLNIGHRPIQLPPAPQWPPFS